MQSAVYPYAIDRHTPSVKSFLFEYDLTSATCQMQVRQLPDATGTPLIDLTNAAVGSEGILLTTVSGQTTMTIQINEATIEGLPSAAEVGTDLVLYYDLQITPSGGIKSVWLRGMFTVRAGVTQ